MKTNKSLLLINPPHYVYSGGHGFNVYYPIGLLYLAAVVRGMCDVEIYDALLEQTEPVDEIEGDRVWVGAKPELIRKRILSRDYTMVGISTQFSSQLDIALHTARIVRENLPTATIMLGGAAATVHAREILSQEIAVDVVVLGEGELPLRYLINAESKPSLWSEIPNIAYRDTNGMIVFTKRRAPLKDLDSFGQLPYKMLEMDRYLKNPNLYINRSALAGRSISVVTSRGCPYKCCFCSIHVHMTREYRTHSTSYVLQNLSDLIDQFSIYRYHFEDDNFSLDLKRYENILNGMIRLGVPIEWDTPNSMMAMRLNEHLLSLTRKAGCRSLYISIESGSQRVIDEIIRKPIDLGRVDRLVRYAKAINLPLSSYYVIGFPGEKIEEIHATLNLALRYYSMYDVVPYVLMATPLPGTKLEQLAIEKGMMSSKFGPSDYAIATQLIGHRALSYSKKHESQIDQAVSEYIRSRNDIHALKSTCK